MTVYAIFGMLIIGHGLDIFRKTEHWPFSNYPMYSEVRQTPTLKDLKIVGVVAAPTAHEVELDDPDYMAPLSANFLRVLLRSENDGAREALASDYVDRYEHRRQAGLHKGPKLSGVRIYALYWAADPAAANVNRPFRRILLNDTTKPKDSPAPSGQGGGR